MSGGRGIGPVTLGRALAAQARVRVADGKLIDATNSDLFAREIVSGEQTAMVEVKLAPIGMFAKRADFWKTQVLVGAPSASGRYAPRIGLDIPEEPDWPAIEKAFVALARSEVRLGAVVLVRRADQRDQGALLERDWRWPYRLGVLPGARIDIEALKQKGWIHDLTQVVHLGPGEEHCEVLIIPSRSKSLDVSGARVRASFVIAVEEGKQTVQARAEQAWRLMDRYKAHGAAVVTKAQAHALIVELTRNLSHDQTVHAALWEACKTLSLQPPVIAGRPDALDRMRIAPLADSFDKITPPSSVVAVAHVVTGNLDLQNRPKAVLLPSRPPRERKLSGHGILLDLPPMTDAALTFPVEGLSNTGPRDRAGDLGKKFRGWAFESEEHYGIPAAHELAEKHKEISEAPEVRGRRATIRLIAANATKTAGIALEREGTPFIKPAQVHWVAVCISAEASGISAAIDFPDEKIAFANGTANISVRFELTGAVVAQGNEPTVALKTSLEASPDQPMAATGTLSLPRNGPSTDAVFLLYTEQLSGTITGTLAFSHRGRNLQLFDVVLPIGETGDGVQLKLRMQATLGFQDLLDRRVFDLPLCVTDGGGRQGARIFRSDADTVGVAISEMQGPTDKISSTITDLAYRREQIMPLDSAEFAGKLRALASSGFALRERLSDFLSAEDLRAERIDIAGSWFPFFPIEFVYDGAAPELDVPICSETRTRLGDRGCGDCTNREAATHVCPLRFWGFSREIERHFTREPGEANVPPPAPLVPKFGILKPALTALSDRAAKFDDASSALAALETAFVNACGSRERANDWDEWRALILANSPNLLVLLPHSAEVDNRDALEIGSGTRKAHHRLQTSISSEDVGQNPEARLLVLLGCDTAQVRRDFYNYPDKFRRHGADLMIATIATIRGADAVPIATALCELLAERKNGNLHTFGQMIAELRRRALLKGAPGVLGVVGFGNADQTVRT